MTQLNQNLTQDLSIMETRLKKETLNVVQHFYNQERSNPYQIAIIEKGRSLTYRELKQEVLETASYFQKSGIKMGDRVLVFVPVSISLYRIVLALFHVGATAVFLDEWSTQERLKKACEVADCKAFIGGWKAKAMGMFIKQIRQIPIWLSVKKPTTKNANSEPVAVNDTDPALITFTTGSTGIPKAADRTHHFLNAQMEALNEELDMYPGMVDMPALPVFVLLNLGNGLMSILPDANMRKPASIKIAKVIQQIQDHAVERIIASPFLIKAIAKYLVGNKIVLSSLKEVHTGGAPIFPDDAQLFLDAFGDIHMKAVYGSTEAEPISSIDMSDLAERNITSGIPVGEIAESTRLQIMAYQDRPIEEAEFEKGLLGTGEIGEIVVTGKHVLKQYFKNEEAIQRNKICHETEVWHRTGDAGFVDKEGELFLVGRCDQLIYFDDKMFSPFVYEYVLKQVKGVSIGTIMKVDEKLVVFVEVKNNYDRAAVETIFEGEEFRIVELDSIPRDPRHHSKIDYKKLLKKRLTI